MTLLPFIQGRIEKFKELAARSGWHFNTKLINERNVEIHITGVPSNIGLGYSRASLLENFALRNNLGVFRPAESILSGKINIFSAHNVPLGQ